jgi:hypothetical protein
MTTGQVLVSRAEIAEMQADLDKVAATIRAIKARIKSPHADKVYLAKGYTKADLWAELDRLA